jgi:hypothetical protein
MPLINGDKFRAETEADDGNINFPLSHGLREMTSVLLWECQETNWFERMLEAF